jgi:hypothetical protein
MMMTWMKRNSELSVLAVGILLTALLFWLAANDVHAQTASPWQVTVMGAQALCTIPAATTPPSATFCFTSDGGLLISRNGAAYTQIGVVAVTGVASVTVCNAAGATCGTPQTGVVSLNIPKSVSVTATLPTATLQ